MESDEKRKVYYISSKEHIFLCDSHPKVLKRASTVNDLIEAYNLKDKMSIVCPKMCSATDLLSFHSGDFVECINAIEKYFEEKTDGDENFDYCDLSEEINFDVFGHGFGYDCEIFPNLSKYIRTVVGGTLTAARLLMEPDNINGDIAINFEGGWHHALVDEVAGFCYVNDIVIGILHLMKKFKKILYIDFDIHHGDGVEEAFKYSNKVVTFSLHKYANGFFPGSGSFDENGCGSGKFHSINVPLKSGIRDDSYETIFTNLFEKLFENFSPEVLVCQCGADMLSGDPLGGFNLTEKCLMKCMKKVLVKNKPTLILGGGGYNIPNTARCWTRLLSGILDIDLDDDIPEHDMFEVYGPDFCLSISPSNRKDENEVGYVKSIIDKVSCSIDRLSLKTDSESNVLDKENRNAGVKEKESSQSSCLASQPPPTKKQVLQEDSN